MDKQNEVYTYTHEMLRGESDSQREKVEGSYEQMGEAGLGS